MHKEPRSRVCRPKGEKGIRCESGTIPVAVYPDSFMKSFGLLQSLPLAKSWEGATNGDESEDLPVHLERLIPAGIRVRIKTVLFIIAYFKDFRHHCIDWSAIAVLYPLCCCLPSKQVLSRIRIPAPSGYLLLT